MIAATLLFLIALTLLNVKLGEGRILYPPLVFTTIWVFDIAFYSTGVVELDPLHPITFLCIALGSLAFTLGGAATKLLPRSVTTSSVPFWTNTVSTGTARRLCIAALLLIFPLFLYQVYRSGSTSGSFSLVSVKASQIAMAAGDNSSQSFLTTIYPEIALWVGLIAFIQKQDKVSIGCLLFSGVSAILCAGRTVLLQLIIATATIYLIRTQRDRIRRGYKIILAAAGGFLLLASVLVFFVKNMTEVDNNASAALQFYILGYVVTGLGPLDYVLTHPDQYLHTHSHTFKFLLQAGQALGLGTTPPPVMDQFLWVPFPTNVYTIYKPFLTDFGFAGMLVAIFALAFLQTVIYRRALQGNKLSLLLTSLILYATVLCFFDDLYIEVKNFGLPIFLAVVYFGVLDRVRLQWSEVPIRLALPRWNLSWRGSSAPKLRITLRPRHLSS